MYLYLDLILLLNFFIDYLLLWMTAIFRKVEVRKWRLAVASAIGSSYILFLFLPPLQFLYTFVVKIILSLVIVLVAFGYGHFQKYMKSFLMFYFVSFITGGGMLAVHFMLQSKHELIEGMIATQSSGLGDPLSWLFVVLGFPLMYWFSKSRWQQIEATKAKTDVLTQVTIYIKGEVIQCAGLIDTGNQLYEPITRTPVMMIEASCLENKIPDSIFKQLIKQHDLTNFELDHAVEDGDWLSRIRMVPYRGVQQGMELMIAIKPDYVELEQENRRYLSKKVLIGINIQPMSKDGIFQAIVHPAMLQNQRKEEAI
jgi:stage II sporulation protein GA (sporulation sigma-E factor processing peptidase)